MNKIYLSLLILLLFFSCKKEELTPLEELIVLESENTEQQTELLEGLFLGMPQKEFYAYCLEKNKTGEYMDGGEIHQVHTKINEGFSRPVDFYFLSNFNSKGLISQKNKFKFQAWTAWDSDTDAEHLFPEVINYLKPIFGDDFIYVENKDSLLHAVDIDANRRVDVYTKLLDDTYVYMDVIDLSNH